MSRLIIPSVSWIFSELIVTALVFGLYRIFRNIKTSPSDRFRFLKLSIVTMPVIPFIPFPNLFRSIDWEKAVTVASTTKSTPEQIYETVRNSPHSEWLFYGIAILYFTLFAVGLFRLFVSLLKVQLIAKEGELVGVHEGVDIIVHDLSIPPATVGIFHPKILIPRKIYTEVTQPQLSMILRHEGIHISRKDYLSNLVAGFIQALLFFSPFTHLIDRDFRAEMELSVDSEVLKGDAYPVRDYGHLLLDLLARINPRPDLVYSGLFASNSLITRRIEAMKNINNKSRPVATFGLFLMLIISGAYGTKALGLQSDLTPLVSPNWDSSKELKLGVGIIIDTKTGVGEASTKVKIALNFEETGSVSLGGKRVDFKPTKTSGSPQMVIDAYDERGELVHHSVIPFTGEAALSAKLDPSTGMVGVSVKIIQL
jgi:beta-lactamase regulating signal transducer with metallopeptidase domain